MSNNISAKLMKRINEQNKIIKQQQNQIKENKIALQNKDKTLQDSNNMLRKYSSVLSSEILENGGTPEYILSQQKICNVLADEKKLLKRIRFNHDQFADIRDKFEELSKNDPESPLFSEDQKSVPGNRCLLSREQVVFLTILQLKSAARQSDLAAEFGVDQPTISRYLWYAKGVMVAILPTADTVQNRVQTADRDDLERLVPDNTIMIDGTHVPMQRSHDYDVQKKYYTFKKKRHTANTAVIINSEGLIIYLGPAHTGSKHDMRVLREDDPELGLLTTRMSSQHTRNPNRPVVYVDLGYVGVEKIYQGAEVMIPVKKPIGGELTKTEKKYNQGLSSIRVKVEHAMGRLKHYRIIANTYDGTLDHLHNDMMIISGLVNFKHLWDHKLKKLRHGF